MSTSNLLLSVHGVSLCSQASLGLSILLPQAPNQQQAQASTSIPAHSLLSLLEPRVDPGSLRRLTKCLSSECEGAVQRMIGEEVSLLFSALETEHRAPESSVLTVMPPSACRLLGVLLCSCKGPLCPSSQGTENILCGFFKIWSVALVQNSIDRRQLRFLTVFKHSETFTYIQ